MGLLIAVALVVWMLHKAVNDGRIDHTYAKQGLVSPRLEAKYGGAAVEKTRRYGLASYIADAWSDLWQRRTAATFAARNLKVTKPGEPVRWRDRWAAARRVATTGYHRLVDPVGEPRPEAKTVVDPQPESVTAPAVVAAAPGAPTPKPPTAPVVAAVVAAPEPATPTEQTTEPEAAPQVPTSNGATMTTTVPSGEATGIVSGVDQAQALRLRMLALKERTLGEIGALLRAVETLSASSAGMEMPPKVQGEIDRTQESLASMAAAVGGTTEEVMASMTAAEGEFAKHLPVVEQSAGLGGLARKDAYAGS